MRDRLLPRGGEERAVAPANLSFGARLPRASRIPQHPRADEARAIWHLLPDGDEPWPSNTVRWLCATPTRRRAGRCTRSLAWLRHGGTARCPSADHPIMSDKARTVHPHNMARVVRWSAAPNARPRGAVGALAGGAHTWVSASPCSLPVPERLLVPDIALADERYGRSLRADAATFACRMVGTSHAVIACLCSGVPGGSGSRRVSCAAHRDQRWSGSSPLRPRGQRRRRTGSPSSGVRPRPSEQPALPAQVAVAVHENGPQLQSGTGSISGYSPETVPDAEVAEEKVPCQDSE